MYVVSSLALIIDPQTKQSLNKMQTIKKNCQTKTNITHNGHYTARANYAMIWQTLSSPFISVLYMLMYIVDIANIVERGKNSEGRGLST